MANSNIGQLLGLFSSQGMLTHLFTTLVQLCRDFGCCCYVLTFWPGQKCHSRWHTGRKWHIRMAVMRRNRVGGNWLMKWDEVKKKSHYTLIDWRTGREWPLNCMTVISAPWRSHRQLQRKQKWHIPIARHGKKLRRRGGVLYHHVGVWR